MLNEQEKTIYKTYIKYSKKFRFEHKGVVDCLGIWKQKHNETTKMVAVVSLNKWAKPIVMGIHEIPTTTYEKNKDLFIEQSLHQIATKQLFLTYEAFKRVAWKICEKVDEDMLEELIEECRKEAK